MPHRPPVAHRLPSFPAQSPGSSSDRPSQVSRRPLPLPLGQRVPSDLNGRRRDDGDGRRGEVGHIVGKGGS